MADDQEAASAAVAPIPTCSSDVVSGSAGDASITSTELLFNGLVSMLSPMVSEIDNRIMATRGSQIELRTQIDSLAEDLRRITDQKMGPVDLDPYIKKVQMSRKRVHVSGTMLQNCHERLLKLHQQIVKETAKRKALLEQPVVKPPS